jgi:membrane protein YdbS with pleckstrin-like domain
VNDPEISMTQGAGAYDPGSVGSAGASEGEAAFLPLDPRVISLWRISQAISSVIILAGLGVLVLVLSLNVPGAFKFAAPGWGLIAVLRLFLFIWYPARAYEAWGYRIDGKVLETRSGVWFRIRQLLPLSRVQHVDLHRGPIERSFGLASLALHTAGTVQSAIVIPGLDAAEATRLRDQLVAIGGDDAV